MGLIWQLNTRWVEPTAWANSHRSAFSDLLFPFCSWVAEWPVVVAALLLALYKNWYTGILAGLFYALEAGIVGLLKNTITASRPSLEAASISSINGIELLQWHSFPSGHTTAAFMGFGLLSMLIPNRIFGVFCAVAAASVGYSRMYLGQHYLRDVLTGATIALLLLYLLTRTLPAYQKLRKPKA